MKKNVDVIVGLQWGDEGKGKIVDLLSVNYDVIARFQGGPNAGHTLEFGNNKYILHTIPSGIFQNDKINYIGNGVVIDPIVFKNEVKSLEKIANWIYKNVYISKQAHLILPTHKVLDLAYESSKGESKIGSTLKGIAPAYTDKYARQGIRVGDCFLQDFKEKVSFLVNYHKSLLHLLNFLNLGLNFDEWYESIEIFGKFNIVDSVDFIHGQINEGKKILAEGAQGTILDVDFGSYPYVTSSNTISGGACIGLGVAPANIRDVIGVFKAYCTRVGNGPFPSELHDEIGNLIREKGNEFGSTTGRPRRCGWLDLVALKFAIQINGVNRLIITKSDVLTGLKEIKVATAYKTEYGIVNYLPYSYADIIEPVYESFKAWDTNLCNIRDKKYLPKEFMKYLDFIQEFLNIPIEIVSVGPDRNANIWL